MSKLYLTPMVKSVVNKKIINSIFKRSKTDELKYFLVVKIKEVKQTLGAHILERVNKFSKIILMTSSIIAMSVWTKTKLYLVKQFRGMESSLGISVIIKEAKCPNRCNKLYRMRGKEMSRLRDQCLKIQLMIYLRCIQRKYTLLFP